MKPRATHLLRAAALVSAGLLLMSCGAEVTVGSGGTPEPSATASPTEAGTPTGSPTAGPVPSESDKKTVPGMPPAAPPDDGTWSPLIPISAVTGAKSGQTLTVSYTLSTPCAPGLREAKVDQRADAVTISLHRRKPQPSDQKLSCVQVIQDKSTTVRLDRPLGDRTVVDGSSGKVVKVTS
ncbi:hypothetical protein [Actinopolymorpha alba]|uniref:hypothetical protein n=1 Tax=Actinopolymorpha alba TaxID=533267 RepID=UPI0003685B6D|nr:hypothetical protein [Actinopolymorpha alba]